MLRLIIGKGDTLALLRRQVDGRHDASGTIKPCHRVALNANQVTWLSIQPQPLPVNGYGGALRTRSRVNCNLLLELSLPRACFLGQRTRLRSPTGRHRQGEHTRSGYWRIF